MSRKYGRYCINNRRSSIIVDHNLQFFSSYQFTNSLELRVDAMLIKPIQRLTRYHMFLSSIAKTSRELGLAEAALEFSLALESVLAAASHTNTMMWIGKMVNCPIDLPSQGQLIKQGKVRSFVTIICCNVKLFSAAGFPAEHPCAHRRGRKVLQKVLQPEVGSVPSVPLPEDPDVV